MNGRWQSGHEVSIAYNVKLPEDKLAVELPRGEVIDADRHLAERFPLTQARAQVEHSGLLFAIHDVQRGADDTFLVVSSVRGTAAYLKEHPPIRRRLNLKTVMLDVAMQPAGSVDREGHRVKLASAAEEGVDYLWWLAARRHFFTIVQGKRKPEMSSASIEIRPGTVRVPLAANCLNLPGGAYVQTSVEVAVRQAPTQPLTALAARVRRDAALQGRDSEAPICLYRWIGQGMLGVSFDQIADAELADGIRQQLEWLRSFDQIFAGTDGRGDDGSRDRTTKVVHAACS